MKKKLIEGKSLSKTIKEKNIKKNLLTEGRG